MTKIRVQDTDISIIMFDDKEYISLTDMVRNIENGLALIEKWLRNKNTIEFLGIWEEMYNPRFNSHEFEGIKNEAGLNQYPPMRTDMTHYLVFRQKNIRTKKKHGN